MVSAEGEKYALFCDGRLDHATFTVIVLLMPVPSVPINKVLYEGDAPFFCYFS